MHSPVSINCQQVEHTFGIGKPCSRHGSGSHGKKRFYRSMTKVKPQDSESNVPAATSTRIEKA